LIDRALRKDPAPGLSGRIFSPIREVSLRSVLLGVVPGKGEIHQRRGGDWLEADGVEDTFFRIANTSPKPVVSCSVSSSMASGAHESVLGAAWAPAQDVAARRACILSVYVREWSERVLPPAMGEWAAGDPALLQDAILRAA
jgi:hypothetical protein